MEQAHPGQSCSTAHPDTEHEAWERQQFQKRHDTAYAQLAVKSFRFEADLNKRMHTPMPKTSAEHAKAAGAKHSDKKKRFDAEASAHQHHKLMRTGMSSPQWQRGPRGGERRKVAGGWEYKGNNPKEHTGHAEHHDKEASKAKSAGNKAAETHHREQADWQRKQAGDKTSSAREARKKTPIGKMSEAVRGAYSKFSAGHGKMGGFFPKHLQMLLNMKKAQETKMTTFIKTITNQPEDSYMKKAAAGAEQAGHQYHSRKPDGKGGWLYDYGDGGDHGRHRVNSGMRQNSKPTGKHGPARAGKHEDAPNPHRKTSGGEGKSFHGYSYESEEEEEKGESERGAQINVSNKGERTHWRVTDKKGETAIEGHGLASIRHVAATHADEHVRVAAGKAMNDYHDW